MICFYSLALSLADPSFAFTHLIIVIISFRSTSREKIAMLISTALFSKGHQLKHIKTALERNSASVSI
jgi:hypothetical protein